MEQPPFVGDWVRKIKLGCGGFGIVTLWQNDKIPDSLAIKMCRPDIANRITPKQRERWTKEVHIMKSISHPNIVHTKRIPQILFEALKEYNISELPILSMEYCSKGSLRHVLNQTENCSGLSESEVRYIFEDISSAIAYLHNMKITHRDLKPDNIVLQTLDSSLQTQPQFNNRTNKVVYKLIDLGYAKELDEKSISESFVGTLQYLAPEILLNKSYSNSVDYWSFGLVAFEIICGVRPFLPNMSPAQWLLQIQKKNSDTICIYQDIDENKSIIHCDKIYAENFISSALQSKFEKWFKLALEYDSKQRGYEKMKPGSQSNSILEKKCVTFNDIEIDRINRETKFFTLLNTALKTKIITVFVVYTYQILSYEIEETLTMNSFLQQIQNDTTNEVLVSEMILVLPNREQEKIDYDGFANQLWTNNFDTPMVHIWKKGQIISEKYINLESSPDLIKRMYSCPKIKILGHFMKKFASDCLYYVKKEMQIYDTLITSCNSKIKIIQENISNMTNAYHDMKSEWMLLSRNLKTSEDALTFDCKNIKNLHISNVDYDKKWTKSFESLCLKVNTIKDAIEHISKRYDSIKRRNNNIDFQKMFRKARTIPEVESIFNDIKQNYEHIRRILKGDFSIGDNPDVCKNLKKAIILFISAREKNMLKDQDMKMNILFILDLDAEITKILSTINSAISNIVNLTNELTAINASRQQDIWAQINVQTNRSNESADNPEKILDFALYAVPKQSIKSNGILLNNEENMINNITNSISGNFDCKSMIDDNISLRYMQQDLIQECLDMYKSIMNDHMDFGFLND